MIALEADFEKRFAAGPEIHGQLRLAAGAPFVTVLFGPSGSGKTTVLRCLAGLEHPEQGFIRAQGQTWFDASRRICIQPQRRNLGYLSQEYALFPHLSVEHNIAYGLGGLAASERNRRIGEMLDLFGLGGLQGRYPSQLSGGQQQRVALARALARRPALLLLDEPLSALDSLTREQMRRQVRRWLAESTAPTLLVTHDRLEALALGDFMVILNDGRVLQAGPVTEVFARPACVAAARIVGFETIEPARVLEVNGNMATLTVRSVQLHTLAQELSVGNVHVCIRAEDVIVEKSEQPHHAANRLPGRVQEVIREGAMTRIGLDCGFPVVALLTHQAAQQLGLREGTQVIARVKPEAVHLLSR